MVSVQPSFLIYIHYSCYGASWKLYFRVCTSCICTPLENFQTMATMVNRCKMKPHWMANKRTSGSRVTTANSVARGSWRREGCSGTWRPFITRHHQAGRRKRPPQLRSPVGCSTPWRRDKRELLWVGERFHKSVYECKHILCSARFLMITKKHYFTTSKLQFSLKFSWATSIKNKLYRGRFGYCGRNFRIKGNTD